MRFWLFCWFADSLKKLLEVLPNYFWQAENLDILIKNGTNFHPGCPLVSSLGSKTQSEDTLTSLEQWNAIQHFIISALISIPHIENKCFELCYL